MNQTHFFHEHLCAVFEFTAVWSPSKYSFAGWLSRLSNVHLSPGKPMKRPKPRGKRQELQQCPQKVRYFFPNRQSIICFGVSILGSYTHFFFSTCVNVFRWTAVWPCFCRVHPREGFQTCQLKNDDFLVNTRSFSKKRQTYFTFEGGC